ncbi:hypothetical protein [Sphingomonas sp. GM_Shp_1]|uniref:hypothetical protein n=1 Tax=Sphingomonas sp. GM_Shp_1 TaxID=2937381 RepID=UPI00226B11AE|nr:hypothetical protein [Sphingomonas sp. GM_Shp_1]
MTTAQRFTGRAAIAVLAVTIALYVGGAFLELTWDFRAWTLSTRGSLAVLDLFLGGFTALVAGASALED